MATHFFRSITDGYTDMSSPSRGKKQSPLFSNPPPKKGSVNFQKCLEFLSQAILTGILSPGDRLPSERRLAEYYGVNRVTIRAALSRLSTMGLLSIRQGSPCVVLDFHQTSGPDLLLELAQIAYQSGDPIPAVRDLLRARRHLAKAVLERIASLTTSPKLESVEDAVRQFTRAIECNASFEELAEADIKIVTAIVNATGSPVLRLYLNPILTALRKLPELRQALYSEATNNALAYELLVNWLKSREPERIETIFEALSHYDELAVQRLRMTQT